jgi:hypothetical protein
LDKVANVASDRFKEGIKGSTEVYEVSSGVPFHKFANILLDNVLDKDGHLLENPSFNGQEEEGRR